MSSLAHPVEEVHGQPDHLGDLGRAHADLGQPDRVGLGASGHAGDLDVEPGDGLLGDLDDLPRRGERVRAEHDLEGITVVDGDARPCCTARPVRAEAGCSRSS